jgi:hypothetical protein
VETNSTNRLESIKPQKNELKTNPERTEKQLDRGAIRVKSSHAPPVSARAKLFHLAKACRAETNALADDGELFFDDRSGNVIENKGTVLESTTLTPPYARRGIPGSRQRMRRVGQSRPEGRRYENCRNKARMFMKTKDRYGKVACRWRALPAGSRGAEELLGPSHLSV